METKAKSPMTKTQKGLAWAGGIIGGLTLLITTIYFITKKKPEDAPPTGGADGGNANDNKGQGFINSFLHQSSNVNDITQQLINSTAGGGTATPGTEFKVLEFQEKTSGATDLVITFAPPRPKIGQIGSGDSVRLSGFGNKFDGDYKIYKKIGNPNAGIWLDSSGNIGAIYIKSGKATSNLNYTVSLTSYPNARVTKL